MRRRVLLLAALLAAVGGLGSVPRSATAVLSCPAHPPGFICTGPPLCRCTRGPGL
jgi:hypothetical protein